MWEISSEFWSHHFRTASNSYKIVPLALLEAVCWVFILSPSPFQGPIPGIFSPEYSLEGLMLRLKLQYFGHLMWRADSLEKILMLGKIEDSRQSGWQRMRWLDGVTDTMDMSLSKLQEMVKDRKVWCAAI